MALLLLLLLMLLALLFLLLLVLSCTKAMFPNLKSHVFWLPT